VCEAEAEGDLGPTPAEVWFVSFYSALYSLLSILLSTSTFSLSFSSSIASPVTQLSRLISDRLPSVSRIATASTGYSRYSFSSRVAVENSTFLLVLLLLFFHS
jgi:hypothetical protein